MVPPHRSYLTRTSENAVTANFAEIVKGEVRRIHLPETVWKIPDGIAVAYAPHHGKQEVRHRPVQEVRHRLVRRPMEVRRSAPSRTQRARTPQDTRFAGDPRRRLLYPQERLPLAASAEGFTALEERLLLVQE